MSAAPDITRLLHHAQQGNADALNRLYEHVYEHLRRIAHAQLQRRSGGTLHTTALVHESYLKLFGRQEVAVNDRAHFFALSARAMRHILVDHFRRRNAEKRKAAQTALTLEEHHFPIEEDEALLLALDEALTRLSELNPRLGKVVECSFFGGMTQEEIALVLDVTDRTVRNDWRKAKAWLSRALTEEPE